ncbi:OmpA family protein [Marinitenerispora sediminis]|uniref:OmpA family protein n=1 Tax=Marinitenerispora sediminis TaxID=1931232 RepID=UPI0011C050F7|nr:OmpA family protein [Marinitenerispora sediminis]
MDPAFWPFVPSLPLFGVLLTSYLVLGLALSPVGVAGDDVAVATASGAGDGNRSSANSDSSAQDKAESVPMVGRPAEVKTRVLFAHGDYQLSSEASAALAEFVAEIERHEVRGVRVAGYADATGPAPVNDVVSLDRARAVADFLRAELSDAELVVEVIGHGSARPAADNGSPEGREANRRVEIVAGIACDD